MARGRWAGGAVMMEQSRRRVIKRFIVIKFDSRWPLSGFGLWDELEFRGKNQKNVQGEKGRGEERAVVK